jgi:hypothetical protein
MLDIAVRQQVAAERRIGAEHRICGQHRRPAGKIDRARDRICQIVVSARRMINAIPPAASNTTLKANDLIDQLRIIQQIQEASVQPR